MFIKKFVSSGLSHFSYLIASETEAVVIDPRRDIQEYLEICVLNGVKIKYIFETHRNEDYIIGSLELQRIIPNIEIYHGNDLPYQYGQILADNQEFQLGSCRIKAIHTPGHTLGSFSFVVFGDTNLEQPQMVFTGDALFAGDTGRTDFYGEEYRAAISAKLYDSIHDRILPLGDGVILYPAHGAGSVCGSKIKEREPTTIGLEKKLNPLLKLSREEFIQEKIHESHTYPPYFKKMEEFNLGTAPFLFTRKEPIILTPKQIQTEIANGATILDTRKPSAFGGAHIKNSISIWVDGLPSFAGWFLNYHSPLILILDKKEDLAKVRILLSRIGFDNILGYLSEGFLSWYTNALPIEQTTLITVHDLKKQLDEKKNIYILDVRSQDEWNSGHLEKAHHIYAGNISQHLDEIPHETPLVIHCTVGLRATVAASYLLQQGYSDISIVLGSFKAWEKAGYSIKR